MYGGNDTRSPSEQRKHRRKEGVCTPPALPDDLIVYYEPVVADRYPDFIVIIPQLGLVIVEVKGWYPAHIFESQQRRGHRKLTRSARKKKHAVWQARDYQF